MNSGAMNLSETECPNCKKDEFSEKYSLKRHVNTCHLSRVPPRKSRWKYPLSDDPAPELPTALQCDLFLTCLLSRASLVPRVIQTQTEFLFLVVVVFLSLKFIILHILMILPDEILLSFSVNCNKYLREKSCYILDFLPPCSHYEHSCDGQPYTRLNIQSALAFTARNISNYGPSTSADTLVTNN